MVHLVGNGLACKSMLPFFVPFFVCCLSLAACAAVGTSVLFEHTLFSIFSCVHHTAPYAK